MLRVRLVCRRMTVVTPVICRRVNLSHHVNWPVLHLTTHRSTAQFAQMGSAWRLFVITIIDFTVINLIIVVILINSSSLDLTLSVAGVHCLWLTKRLLLQWCMCTLSPSYQCVFFSFFPPRFTSTLMGGHSWLTACLLFIFFSCKRFAESTENSSGRMPARRSMTSPSREL